MLARVQSLMVWLTVLLLVVVSLMALRSVWVVDEFIWTQPSADGTTWTVFDLQSLTGDVLIARLTRRSPLSTGWGWRTRPTAADDFVRDTWIGFSARRVAGGGAMSFPLLAFIVPTLALATIGYVRTSRQLRQRERMLAGVCVSCGYDLQASPDCCPECGQVSTDSVFSPIH